MDKGEKALERLDDGYNCAQCVLLAYSDQLGIDELTAFRVAEGLGAGMGDYQGVCGSLSGAILAVGLMTDGRGMTGEITKGETYQVAADLKNAFIEEVGSELCHEIRETDEHPALMSCEDCVLVGIDLVGRLLENREKQG
ncbi:MAG TPA: C_GCAxxG_C_C family protein [Clostridiales bacterium]|jgi:C_GCAxxG_C_C family probable redox protein|nr:C_GCAxxG_C_C family protein [Clostridiales bacterium]